MIDKVSIKVLEKLSEDSRTPVSAIAKEIGCAPATAARRIRWLEEQLGMSYTLEINEYALGVVRNLVRVKFKKQPDVTKLRNLLLKHNTPQFAALTKGDFDLVIYGIAESPSHFNRWAHWFRYELEDHIEEWKTNTICEVGVGFFPYRNDFLKGIPLDEAKRKILLMLNENSRISLKEIAERAGIPVSTAQYYLNQLMSREHPGVSVPVEKYHKHQLTARQFIQRPTIALRSIPLKPTVIQLVSYLVKENFMKAVVESRKALTVEEELEPMNNIVYSVNCLGDMDDIYIACFSGIGEINKFQERVRKGWGGLLRGEESALVLQPILGSIGYRKLDLEKAYAPESRCNVFQYLEEEAARKKPTR
ncbi:winged helix-turn-helix transcriptional regulator [Candidatus Micrarchaeota archaeon]|nr:winged helix-turn-helix transcriptional regulator [Candidatus Micrarchaeota archaeon]